MGRGLDWTNGFSEHMLGTSPGLGLGAAEMKDVGEAALRLQKAGRLEGRSEGAVRWQCTGSPLLQGRQLPVPGAQQMSGKLFVE